MRKPDGVLAKGRLEIELRDERKRLIRSHVQPVRSFLANWTKALYGLTYGNTRARATSLVDTGGVARSYPYLWDVSYTIFCATAPLGNIARGLLFGSGTSAKSINDYNLEAKIEHGTGAGQLYYYETASGFEVLDDRSKLWFERMAQNEGTEDVTVSEVGLAFSEHDASGTVYYFLILADLLDEAVMVAPGKTITARYVFEFLF